MMKKNIYITLTLLCVIAITVINLSSKPSSLQRSSHQELFPLTQAELLHSPHLTLFALCGLVYASLLLIGIVTLCIGIARLTQKQPVLSQQEPIKTYPLNAEKTNKLFFLLSFFMLLMNGAGLFSSSLKGLISPFGFVVLFNLVTECGAIIAVLALVPIPFLFSRLKKQHLLAVATVYVSIFPLILGALLVSSFILKHFGIHPEVNPAIELLVALKNKPLLLTLMAQVTLLGPIAEELFFRGILFSLLRKRLPFWLAATTISLVFSLIHRTPQDALSIFIISYSLCYVYEKTQTITAPILLHITHNTLNVSVLLLLKSAVN